ncbi:alkyl sulfatase C-terminal domain-containing protein [Streptomyces nitrosporeus]|uniref:alkyl sulfatase C-terminal domain-containing protein n=1 Tax=Streptomyces nitrosporeus TaxID=28894 RepID=UPI003318CBD0
MLAEGRRAFEEGGYRWATQILHALVFADPGHTEAKNIQADAYEQMGYQAEGPQWRGIFLTAARELREGVVPAAFATAGPDTVLAMPIDILFDFAAVHLIGDKAAKADLRIGFQFTDHGDGTWAMWIRRGVLNARPGASLDPLLTVAGPKAALVSTLLKPAGATELARAGKISLDGDKTVLQTLAGLLDDFDPDFPLVIP